MRTIPLTTRGLTLPAIVTLVLVTVLAVLVVGASAVSAQGSAPDTPDQPIGTVVFAGGVDLEWNDVAGADSYDVQLYRNGQWLDLPGDGVEIAFYGAGAIISGLDPNATLWFQVRARNAHGFSDWSNFSSMASTNQFKLGRRARPDNVPASGAPLINGTAQVGESLTADTSDVEDGNGLDRVQFRFQWISHDGSADTDIASATDSTYTLAASDEGKTIKVRVAFTDRGGYAESLTGGETATVAARPNSPATGAPSISGIAQVGETLTADTTGIADADGLSGATFSYQWAVNDGTSDADITGATDSTHTLVAADEGKTIKVWVSFTDDAGNGESLTSAPTAAVAARPNTPATGQPTIIGTAQAGERLTASTSGIADNDGLTGATFAYQWLADDAEIAGATGSTYDLTSSEMDRAIKVRVSFTDDGGNDETLTSAATGVVSPAVQPQTANNPATGVPAATGTAQVGETLTVDTSSIDDDDGLTNVSYSYKWIRSDGSTDTDIQNATDATYTLVADDVSKTIKVKVTFTDDAGNEEALTSAATDEVSFAVQQQQANSPATGTPTVTGTAQVGETLTADISGIADDDGLSGATFTYQWIANDGTADTDIQDATGPTYTLVSDLEGKTLKVRVSFADEAGNDESLTSAATAAVAAEDPQSQEPPAQPLKEEVFPQPDTTPPTISSIAITSDPDEGDVDNVPYESDSCAVRGGNQVRGIGSGCLFWPSGIYGIGDRIKATVTFSEDVTVTGKPRIELDIGGRAKAAEYEVGEGPAVVFSYTVAEGDLDSDGISIGADMLTLMGGSIKDAADNNANLSHSALAEQEDHQVDGIRPRVSGIDLLSSTSDAVNGFFNAGEFIFVNVRFSERILSRGNPQLILDFDGEAKAADWSGWLSSHLYVIQEGDLDADGVAIGANAIDLNGGFIKDAAGNDAVLTHAAVAPDPGLIVDAVLPVVSSIAITSEPGEDESYGAGDRIEVTVTFSENVTGPTPQFYGSWTYLSGTEDPRHPKPQLELNIGGEARTATYLRNENASLVFEYYVRAGDSDDDGIAIGANKLSANGASISDAAGNKLPSDAVVTHGALADDSGHKVYGGSSVLTLSGKTTINYQENGSSTVAEYMAGAPGTTIAWDLSGNDSDYFSIHIENQSNMYNPRRAMLAFSSSPNYEDPADADSDNRYEVTIHASDGTDSGTLHVIVVVANEWLDNDEVPVIVGTARVGETLTTDEHLISHPGPFLYQWLRNDGNTDTIVEGAYDSSYTLTDADEGKAIKVRVKPVWKERWLTSEPTVVVAPNVPVPGNSPASGAPTIRGTAQVDETLTVDTSSITDADGLTDVRFSYRWIRNDGATDSDIIGATGAAYTLVAHDQGKTIKVRVSFADDAGNTETLTSEATAAVTFNSNSPEPGLTSMSVSSGALSPTFHNRTMRYTVPEVANAVRRITLTTTAKAGYTVTVIRDANSIGGVCGGYGQSCTITYSDDSGNGLHPLTDAEADTPGFQVDLDEGENVFAIHVFPPDGLGDLYMLTVTRTANTLAANIPATGAPAISGTAQVGETLTSDTSGIVDADGLTNVGYSYQWIRNDGISDADMPGATDSNYTVVDADESKTIKVRVSFTDDAGNVEILTSTVTDTVNYATQPQTPNIPATGEPTISGRLTVGESLTASTWRIEDADGLENATFSYQWTRWDQATGTRTDIPGATGSTYVVTAADRNRFISVIVSFMDDAGHEETLGSYGYQVRSPDSLPTGVPTINGTARVGLTLTASTWRIEDADGLENATFSYQWTRLDLATAAWTNIAGATGSTYVVTAVDRDSAISVTVSFADDTGHEYTWRSYGVLVLPAASNNAATGAPAISGTAQVGETLTSDTSGIADNDGLNNVTFSYQWVANDGTSDTDIEGATDSTYTLVADHEAKTIKVRVSFTDDAGNEETLTSAATDTVSFATQRQTFNSLATGAPTISGTDQVGETLTADTTGIADADGLSGATFRYQWIRSEGSSDADITDATDSTYTLVDADEGETIKVEVSFTDDADNEETLASAATAEVAAGAPTDPPGKPRNLTGTANSDGTVTLRWDAPNDDSVSGYQILRRRPREREKTLLVHVNDTGSIATEYTDNDVTPDVLHAYRVKAINAVGLSGQSNFVSVTPAQPAGPAQNSPATGRPTIGGTAQVRETLTADTYGIADDDGLNNVSYNYQWVRNGGTSDTDIQNATGSSYALVDADEGRTIKVEVSFTDDAGNDESLTSVATATVAAVPNNPATGTPTISGTAQVGETLTADTSGIADDDGLSGVAYSYQWLANDADIADATGSTHTLEAAAEGRTIRVRVSFADDAGNDETLTSAATAAVAAQEQQSQDPPAKPAGLSATAVFAGGVDLEWNDVAGADSYDVQLYRNGQWIDLPGDGVEIAFYGAGAIVSGLDPNSTLWFQVRAKNAHGFSNWSNYSSLSGTNQFKLGRRARPDNVPASGAPVINGTAQVGESLTADTTGIEDGNGLDRVQFRFQWVSHDGSADTDIASATDSTYTLAASDEGKTIKVRVAFTDRGGYAESLTSAATATVAAAPNSPATGVPVISGTAEVGNTLTADTSDIADADGLSGATFTYQWIANDGTADTDKQDATDSTYTLVAADEGKTIKMRVSFTDDAGNVETLTSTATSSVAARPNRAATGAPMISGTAHVGETLSADTSGIGDADGLTNVSYSYQWIRNDGSLDTDITDAADSSYTLVAADDGKTIKVRVSFTDDAGNDESLNSAATATIAATPNSPATGAPAVTGTAQVGETLTADTSGIADTDGLTNVAYNYQWIANDGTADTDIQNATGPTYTLVSADEGKTIKVRVSFTDDAANEETLTSTATEAVSFAVQQQIANSPATGAPAVTGTAQVGKTLTADTTGIADTDGLTNVSFSYQWVANDGTVDTNITDATDSTCTLAADDVGKTIKVTVSFTDDAGNEETLTSSATAAVDAALNTPATGAPAISGTAQVGETLTADTSGISDADGLASATFAYQWLADDAELASATGGSYVLTTTEMDKTIKVRVSFTDDAGNEETLTSTATGTVSPAVQPQTANSPATGVPAVTGTAQVGETLTADTSGIADDDGLVNVIYSYQWVANDGGTDADISGETDATYMLVADDEGKTIKVKVTFTDDADNEETLTSAATGKVQQGTDVAGHILHIVVTCPGHWVDDELQSTCSTAYWVSVTGSVTRKDTDAGPADYALRLDLLDGDGNDADECEGNNFEEAVAFSMGEDDVQVKITGELRTYACDPGDHTVVLTVTFGDGRPDETLTIRLPLAEPAQNSAATGAPTIRGTAQVGETLTADTSGIADDDLLSDPTFSYQWVANDGTSDTDIAGATDSTYTVIAADVGKTIKVRVSFTDDAGNEETLTSTATDTVSYATQQQTFNNPATGAPTISGSAQVGETLTADTSGIADTDGLTRFC